MTTPQFICVTVVGTSGIGESLEVLNTHWIRSAKPHTPKASPELVAAGVQTVLLVQYAMLEDSVVFIKEHISVIAERLKADGRPQ